MVSLHHLAEGSIEECHVEPGDGRKKLAELLRVSHWSAEELSDIQLGREHEQRLPSPNDDLDLVRERGFDPAAFYGLIAMEQITLHRIMG